MCCEAATALEWAAPLGALRMCRIRILHISRPVPESGTRVSSGFSVRCFISETGFKKKNQCHWRKHFECAEAFEKMQLWFKGMFFFPDCAIWQNYFVFDEMWGCQKQDTKDCVWKLLGRDKLSTNYLGRTKDLQWACWLLANWWHSICEN